MKSSVGSMLSIAVLLCCAAPPSALANPDVDAGIRALRDVAERDDYGARNFAYRELKRGGRHSVKPLVRMLGDSNDKARELAARALSQIGEDAAEAIPGLIAALADDNPSVRGSAVIALGAFPDDAEVCVPAILSALMDEEMWPRSMATMVLPGFKEQAPDIIRQLCEGLESGDARLRRASVSGLGGFTRDHENLVPPLVDALDDPDASVRLAALNSLRRAGDLVKSEVPKFISMMKDSDSAVRREAALALHAGRHTTEEDDTIERQVVSVLLDAMESDTEVCNTAAGVLGNLGRPGYEALATLLTSSHPDARLAALGICAERGDLSEIAKPALVEALNSTDQAVRWKAALGLAQTNAVAEAAKDVLSEILTHPDAETLRMREQVVWVSNRMHGEGVPLLIQAARDPDSYIRSIAVLCFGEQRDAVDAVMPTLIGLLGDADSTIRAKAIEAIVRLDPAAAAARPVLAELLHDKDAEIRLRAAEVLAPDDGAAVETLLALLSSDDASVRVAAASKLSKLGGFEDAVIPVLRRELSRRNQIGDVPGDIAAAEALVDVGSRAAESGRILRRLDRMLDDRDMKARIAAMNALTVIAPDRDGVLAALVRALESAEADERTAAIRDLTKMGSIAKDAVPALERLCRSDWRVQYEVNTAIDTILAEDVARYRAELDPSVVSILIGLGSDDTDVGRPAYENLMGMGQRAVPDIMRALSDEKYRLRDKAVDALCQIGPEVSGTEPAIPCLLQLLDDYRPYVRASAVSALVAIRAPNDVVLRACIQTLSDSEYAVLTAAAAALRTMGKEAKPAMGALVCALENESAASLVSRAIIEIGPDPAHVPEMIHFMQVGEPGGPEGTRPAATRVLCHLGPSARGAVPQLQAMLGEAGDNDLRCRAAQVLAAVGPDANETLPILQAIAADPNESWGVRLACAGAWRCVGSASGDAINVLAEGLKSEISAVRGDAVDALAYQKPLDEPAVVLLGEALGDADVSVRYKAITTLRCNGGDVRPVLNAIQEVASGANDEAYYARGILGQLGAVEEE